MEVLQRKFQQGHYDRIKAGLVFLASQAVKSWCLSAAAQGKGPVVAVMAETDVYIRREARNYDVRRTISPVCFLTLNLDSIGIYTEAGGNSKTGSPSYGNG